MGTALPALRVSLLNGFRLHRNRESIALPLSHQRLLAFIALGERPRPRLQVAGTLWPDASERRSNASLRSALWRLRLIAVSLIRATKQHVELEQSISVDYREANQAAQQILAGKEPTGGALMSVLREPGELLPGWYDDWVIFERERYRELRLRALEFLCRQCLQTGRSAEAVDAGLAAVTSEPLRETSRRALIEANIAEGNFAEARRQYELFRRILQQTLRLRPSQRMESLMAAVNAGTV